MHSFYIGLLLGLIFLIKFKVICLRCWTFIKYYNVVNFLKLYIKTLKLGIGFDITC